MRSVYVPYFLARPTDMDRYYETLTPKGIQLEEGKRLNMDLSISKQWYPEKKFDWSDFIFYYTTDQTTHTYDGTDPVPPGICENGNSIVVQLRKDTGKFCRGLLNIRSLLENYEEDETTLEMPPVVYYTKGFLPSYLSYLISRVTNTIFVEGDQTNPVYIPAPGITIFDEKAKGLPRIDDKTCKREIKLEAKPSLVIRQREKPQITAQERELIRRTIRLTGKAE